MIRMYRFPFSSLSELNVDGMRAVLQLYNAMFGRGRVWWEDEAEVKHHLKLVKEGHGDFRIGSAWDGQTKLKVDFLPEGKLAWKVNANFDPKDRHGPKREMVEELEKRFAALAKPGADVTSPGFALWKIPCTSLREQGAQRPQTEVLSDLIWTIADTRGFLEPQLSKAAQKLRVGTAVVIEGKQYAVKITRVHGGFVTLELRVFPAPEKLPPALSTGYHHLAMAFQNALARLFPHPT